MDAMKVRGGDKNYKVMGFSGSNHGQGIAMSQFAHPSMSIGLSWPVLNYSTNEASTLEEARKTIKHNKVAAVVIEPTNWQTGRTVSDYFISELKKIS